MLDLVNENYQDFLSLGSSLQGGDEKVEEVRLGLLGFKRDVEGLKSKVDERRDEVAALVTERKEIRRQILVGRTLLDVDERLRNLEQNLMLVSNEVENQHAQSAHGDHGLSESGDESEEGEDGSILVSRLSRHVRHYLLADKVMRRIGSEHPFVAAQESRMARLKDTILLDLGNALKQGDHHDERSTIRILALYRDMGEPQEALKNMSGRRR